MVHAVERNVVEITKNDLLRMRGSPPDNRRARFLKEKLKLKELSDERARRWPNTIKALHEKRIQAKKDELARLEIERANKMLILPHMTCLLFKRQRENTDKLKEHEERLMEQKRRKEEEKAWLNQLEEEDRIQAEEKENLRQERIKERNLDMVKGNEAQKAKKEEERQRLIKLDKEIEEFAKKKEKMMDERKQLEAMKIALKTQQRDAISEKLYKRLLANKVDTDMRLEREQNNLLDLEDKREQMRVERNKKSWEECDRSRKMQIKCRQEQATQDAANEKYEAERSWERAWICKLEFEASERERIKRNEKFAEHHKKTMGINAMKELEAATQEIEDERLALQRMEDDEKCGITLEDIKL